MIDLDLWISAGPQLPHHAQVHMAEVLNDVLCTRQSSIPFLSNHLWDNGSIRFKKEMSSRVTLEESDLVKQLNILVVVRESVWIAKHIRA